MQHPPPPADASATEDFTTPPPSGGGGGGAGSSAGPAASGIEVEPGVSGSAPGLSESAPGVSGTAPGVSGSAPGVSLFDRPPPPGAPSIPDFHVTGRLGAGGMGVVWRAVQRSTRREVALKVLSGGVLARPRARLRFEREVELAARLEHPHIARVYDAGVHTDPDGGLTPWYAMERVDGRPLDEHVKANALDREQLLTLLEKVAAAVGHAHRHGIIHRDLKPANILVSDAGRPAVLDFGLAKLLDPGSADPDAPANHELTIEGQIAGTPAYMSPEQADGRSADVDTRSDVYALGVILYRLVTGHPPHDLTGGSTAVLRRVASEPARPARRREASAGGGTPVDGELATLLGKALEHEPDRRYDSAAALAEDLRRLRLGEPLLARRPTVSYLLGRRLKRHRRWVAAAAVALLVGAGGTGWAWSRPATVPLASEPTGAEILIDGVSRKGCNRTPCVARLGPGRHTLELRHPGFQTELRVVNVNWGRHQDLEVESTTLVPDWRLFHFVSEPAGRRGLLSHATEPGRELRFVTPSLQRVPAGDWDLAFDDAPRAEPERIEVRGNLTTVEVRRDRAVEPAGATG